MRFRRAMKLSGLRGLMGLKRFSIPVPAAARAWLTVAVGGLFLFAIAVADRALPPPLTRALDLSPTLLDVDGKLLRAGTSPAGYWRLPARVSDVDPRYLRALLAFEDRRFYAHGGADYRGLARAVVTSALAGRIVSGGSTLSMQTARLLEPRPDRTAQAKVLEILRAWQLERRFNKHEILDLYLLTAPFGGNIDGVAAATRLYFGKAPAELTWAESALLVALPQNPAGRRPDRFPQQAEAARNRVLDVLVARDILSHEEAERAKREPVPTRRLSMPFYAPTLAERLWEDSGSEGGFRDDATVQTTLHADTQIALEALLTAALDRYAGTINGAMLVIDADTGAVRARVGSSGYFEERAGARLDLTRAPRSPGSALKPAIYALAFEAGLAHPATWLPDDQRNFQGYQPENFSRSRQGRVQAYAALQQSLNPPAVALLQAVGPERALEALNRAGIHPANQGAPGSVGLSLALGGVSLRMEDLAALFTAFATDGAVRPLCETPAQCSATRPKPFIGPRSAAQVTAILAESPQPLLPDAEDLPRVAFKTGTSARHRDAWAIGYDGQHVIAVWLGRADNQPTGSLVGLADAVPVLLRAFAGLDNTRRLRQPEGRMREILAGRPAALSHLAGLDADDPDPLSLVFPTDEAAIPLAEGQPLALRLSGGQRPFRLFVDGLPLAHSISRQLTWRPAGPGFYILSVVDGAGRTVEARVEIMDTFANLAALR